MSKKKYHLHFILLPGAEKEKKSKGVSEQEGQGQLKSNCGEEMDRNTPEDISERSVSHGLQQWQSAASKRRSLKLTYNKRRSHNKPSGASPAIFPFIVRREPHMLCSILPILHMNWTKCAFKYTARERKEMPRVMSTHPRVTRALRNTTGLQPHKSQGTVRNQIDFGRCLFFFTLMPLLI